jgi:hypothetical protein
MDTCSRHLVVKGASCCASSKVTVCVSREDFDSEWCMLEWCIQAQAHMHPFVSLSLLFVLETMEAFPSFPFVFYMDV